MPPIVDPTVSRNTYLGSDVPASATFKKGFGGIVARAQKRVFDFEVNEMQDILQDEALRTRQDLWTDGIFLGNVFQDAVIRNSFKVSYGGGTLTVAAGRARLGGLRLDLFTDITGPAGVNPVPGLAGFALPAGGHVQVIYIDIYNREVETNGANPYSDATPLANGNDPYLATPSGEMQRRYQYWNFRTDVTFALDAMPAPVVGHQYMQLATVDSTGAVIVDFRTLAFIKSPVNPQIKGLILSEFGTIGIDCTHTSFDAVMTDINTGFLNTVDVLNTSGLARNKFIWVKGGQYAVTPGATYTIPSNTSLIGIVNDSLLISKALSGASRNLVTETLPSINNSAVGGVTFSGQFNLIKNLQLSTNFGSYSGLAKNYNSCNIFSFSVASELIGTYFNCAIAYLASNTANSPNFVNCSVNIEDGGQVPITIGNNAVTFSFTNCLVNITSNANSGAPLSITAGQAVFEECDVHFNVGSTNNAEFCALLNGATASTLFIKCSLLVDSDAGGTTHQNIFKITGGSTATLKDCHYTSAFADALFSLPTGGGTLNIIGGSYINTSTTGIDPMVGIGNGPIVNIQGGSLLSKACGNVIGGGLGSVLQAYNSLIQQTNNTYNCINFGDAAQTIVIKNCDCEHLGTGIALSITNAPVVSLLSNSSFISNDGVGAVSAIAYNIAGSLKVANCTYSGAISGGGTFTALAAGSGTNASNVQV